MLSLPDKNFQPSLFAYSAVFVRICFEAGLSSNMPKITSFLLKNHKTRPALWDLLPEPGEPLCLRRLGSTHPDPHISSVSLRIPRCANYNRRFK